MLEQLEFDFIGDNPHICLLCGDIAYSYLNELAHHMAKKHPIGEEEIEYDPDPISLQLILFLGQELDDPL